MVAVSGEGPTARQIVCIGLPYSAVELIAGVADSDVCLVDVPDPEQAIAALAAMTYRHAAVFVATNQDPVPSASTGVQLDRQGRRGLAGGRDLKLSPREFDLLALLLESPGRAWSYDDLSSRVWRQPYLGDPDMIATAIRRLRKRLGPDSGVEITALRGHGYRLDVQDHEDEIAEQRQGLSGVAV